MKSKGIKSLALILTLLMMTFLLNGCSRKTANQDLVSSTDKSAQTLASPEALTLPIVKEPMTLTYFTPLASKVAATMKSHEEMACYKELEKRTGIHIKFIHPPIGQETEQFNLMLASQDLPDMIYWNWIGTPGGPAKALGDNTIIKLNDEINKYAPSFKKLMTNNPDARKQTVLDDGSQYSFAFLRLDPYLMAGGPIIRKDWLDKLGLSVPKTMDEWSVMLKAFKEKDPNGNGKADEVPLIAQKGDVLEGLPSFAAMFGIINCFYQDNGKVKYGPIEARYKEYMTTMNKWYKEGLIDADFASTDGKSFDAKVTSNIGGAYIGRINNTFGRYLTLMRGKSPEFNLIGGPWPIGPGGKPYNIRADMVSITTGEGVAITTKNKHVKESVKWLDYQYSEQGHMLMNFGIEGESYKMENNYPKYTDLISKNPKGLAILDVLSQYCVSAFSGPIVQDRRYFEQTLTWPEQGKTIDIWAQNGDTSLLIPPITNTETESKKVTSVMGDVDTYVSEMYVKFIMGVESIDKYDQFVQTIKKMGVEDVIKMKQAALDRYNNRK